MSLEIELRGGWFIHAGILRVFDNPDDREPHLRVKISRVDATPDRTASPESFGECLIHHHYSLRAVVIIRRLKDAALNGANPHRFVVVVTHHVPVINILGGPIGSRLVTLDLRIVGVDASERWKP